MTILRLENRILQLSESSLYSAALWINFCWFLVDLVKIESIFKIFAKMHEIQNFEKKYFFQIFAKISFKIRQKMETSKKNFRDRPAH